MDIKFELEQRVNALNILLQLPDPELRKQKIQEFFDELEELKKNIPGAATKDRLEHGSRVRSFVYSSDGISVTFSFWSGKTKEVHSSAAFTE
jgi:hypothetical protein